MSDKFEQLNQHPFMNDYTYVEDKLFVNCITYNFRFDTTTLEIDKCNHFELVYNHFGDLVLKKEFYRVNQIIDGLLDSIIPGWALMPFLTLTGREGKKRYPKRQQLFEKACMDWINTMSPSQYEATFKRLQ